jgi:hypothetical protein
MFRSFRVAAAAATLAVGSALTAAPAAAQQAWNFALSGATETPPVATPGTGFGTATLTGNMLRVQASWSNLLGLTTVAHIHCCTGTPFAGTAIVATPTPSFPDFPTGVQSGTYDRTFDLTLPGSFNAAFITASGGTVALAAQRLIAGMNAGTAYLNIHTNLHPGGEINGFASVVPEPGTYALVAAGLAGIGAAARRRRQRA